MVTLQVYIDPHFGWEKVLPPLPPYEYSAKITDFTGDIIEGVNTSLFDIMFIVST